MNLNNFLLFRNFKLDLIRKFKSTWKLIWHKILFGFIFLFFFGLFSLLLVYNFLIHFCYLYLFIHFFSYLILLTLASTGLCVFSVFNSNYNFNWKCKLILKMQPRQSKKTKLCLKTLLHQSVWRKHFHIQIW